MKQNHKRSVIAYLLPSIRNILWMVVFIGVIGLGPRMMNIDGDLGRHLTIGRYILDTRTIPLHDMFSHTMYGQALTPHEWLSQVFFAFANQVMGLDGVVLLCALIIAAAFGFTFRRTVRQGGGLLAALLFTVLAIGASSIHWLTRPHIFTFLMLVVWVEALEQLREGKTWQVWWMPVWMLVWANLHGAFIAGFMVWGMYGAAYVFERFIEGDITAFAPGFWKGFLLSGAASLIATLINPAGTGLWATSLGYVGNSYLVGHTAEYLSPDFHNPAFWPFMILLIAELVLFALAGKRRPALDVILLAGWSAMSLFSMRNIPLFALLCVPILAKTTKEWLHELAAESKFVRSVDALDGRLGEVESRMKGWLWPALLVVFTAAALMGGSRQSANRFSSVTFPTEAMDWVKEHPQQGEVFNYFPWGGYLLYRSWPDVHVFIDGQTDFYGEALTRQYERVLTLQPGWQEILAQYKVDWVLMPPDEALTQSLTETEGWQVVYKDKTAWILTRRRSQ